MPHKKVLIIDDEPHVGLSLARFFIDAGAVVESVHDYDTGLASLKSFLPDVALVDVLLHDKNGIDLIREAKAEGAVQPMYVVLTNAVNPEYQNAATDLGIALYLQKAENDPHDIVNTVSQKYAELHAPK